MFSSPNHCLGVLDPEERVCIPAGELLMYRQAKGAFEPSAFSVRFTTLCKWLDGQLASVVLRSSILTLIA